MPSGTANHRSFSAPSDQKGTLTAYGMTPLAGFVGSFGSTQPVSESFCGNGSAPVTGAGTTLRSSDAPASLDGVAGALGSSLPQ